MAAPSGEQFELKRGEQQATVVEVGAGIREYAAGGRDVLEPYPPDAICDGGHGAVLIPWPNRLGGGRYSFAGAERRLDLSEPARGNAIHGLMRWRPWRAAQRTAARVVMAATLHPHPGYPFTLELRVSYTLTDDGLEVACTARNAGAEPCPYGCGQHPYLYAGAGGVDECELQLPAQTHIVVDEGSRLPIRRRDVSGTELDFNRASRIGARQLDDALTDLARDAGGHSRATLACADGATLELWADEHHKVLQVFTGDTLAEPRRRTALAVEPMTCPADAFRSGEELIVLEPGDSFTSRWGVRRTG